MGIFNGGASGGAGGGSGSAKNTLVVLPTFGWVENEIEDDEYEGWYTRTLSVTGVTSTSSVVISPEQSNSNIDNYNSANVRVIGQGNGTLTFCCASEPDEKIEVNVLIVDSQTVTTQEELPVPTRVYVVDAPTKTYYEVGEQLSFNGLFVMADYNDGESREVTSQCTYSPAAGTTLSLSNTSVTITIGSVSTTQAITVVQATQIYIATPPEKTSFTVGDTLSFTGLVVNARYSDNSTKNITSQCTFSPSVGTVLSMSDTSVTISWRTFTTTQAISVSNYAPPAFSSGTDAQIAEALQKHYNNEIDLTDYWAVGNTRTITLGAFTGGGNTSHAQQSIDIVITSFAEYEGCGNFMQFDFKDCLATLQRVHSSGDCTNYGTSEIVTTTFPAMVNALPSWLKDNLKTFSVKVNFGGNASSASTVTGNKLALRSCVELGIDSSGIYANEGVGIPYYTDTTANRIKTQGHGGSNYYWSLRSPVSGSTANYCLCRTGGDRGGISASTARGIAPFGCL